MFAKWFLNFTANCQWFLWPTWFRSQQKNHGHMHKSYHTAPTTSASMKSLYLMGNHETIWYPFLTEYPFHKLFSERELNSRSLGSMFLTDSQPLDLLRSCLEDVPLEVLKASVRPNSVQKELLLFRYWKCQKTKSVVAYNDRLKRDTYHFIWHIEVIEVNNISISIDPLPLATISCPPVVLIAWLEASRSLCSWFASGAALMGHLQHSILSQTTCSTTRSGSHPKSEKVFRCTFLGKEMSVWPESWKDECLSVHRGRNAIYMIISLHVHYSTCWFLLGSTQSSWFQVTQLPIDNFQEFVDGLAKAGCCRTRRRKRWMIIAERWMDKWAKW